MNLCRETIMQWKCEEKKIQNKLFNVEETSQRLGYSKKKSQFLKYISRLSFVRLIFFFFFINFVELNAFSMHDYVIETCLAFFFFAEVS